MLKPIRGCFSSAEDVEAKLSAASYLCTPDIATTVYLAAEMGKPVLVEGPAGVGKTELAKASAAATGAGLIRLQCYEGLDEARAIYEWNYKKQLLRLQAAPSEQAWDALQDDIFSADFLLARPLLTAIRRSGPTVLLIDEIDKADVEMEALLLEVLSDFQITVPELGTIAATSQPLVVLTSNGTRDLSEALKRRCLWLHIGYPDPEREREIVSARVARDRHPRAVRTGRDRDRTHARGAAEEHLRPRARRRGAEPGHREMTAYLVGGVRTPLGRYGGALAKIRPDDLAVSVVSEAVRRAGVDPAAIDEVILRVANQAGEDNCNVARMAVLLAGLPTEIPGYTVNRLCASGLTALATAADAMHAGDADIVVADGVESMTRVPWVMQNPGTPWARPASCGTPRSAGAC